MLIYTITIAITVFFAWLVEHSKQKKICFFFMLMIPTCISGLRGVGTDYTVYKIRYDKILNGIDFDEYGTNLTGIFYKFCSFIGKNFGGYQTVIFIISLLTLGIAFYIFYKMRNELSFTFSVFSYMTLFYLYSFNMFRQFLSAELFILSLWLYKTKKQKIYVIIALALSICFHSSSLIYLCILIAIPFIKRNRYLRKCIYVLSIVLIIMIPYLAGILGKFATIFTHYSYYFLHFRYLGLGFGILRYVFLIWIPIYLISYHKNYFLHNLKNNYQEYIIVVMFGSIFSLLSYVSDTFIYRIGYTGLCAAPIVLGLFFKTLKRKKQITGLCLVSIHIMFLFYDFFYLNTGNIIPYSLFGGH